MRRLALLAVLALLPAQAGAKRDMLGRPAYGPLTLLRLIGYHDHVRDDGTVVVEASSSPHEGEGFAARMALYRAAEVADAQGHAFFQLLKSSATVGTGMMNRGQERVMLRVRFADSAGAPGDCQQPRRSLDGCRTFEVRTILTRFAEEMEKEPPIPPAVLLPAAPVSAPLRASVAPPHERSSTVNPPLAKTKKIYAADDAVQTPL